jgi:hypothetical protein
VWADRLVDASFAGESTHDPPGSVAVQPLAVAAQKDRAVDPFTDGQVDRASGPGREGDGDDLAALAQHGERAVASLEAECVDIGAERLGHA